MPLISAVTDINRETVSLNMCVFVCIICNFSELIFKAGHGAKNVSWTASKEAHSRDQGVTDGWLLICLPAPMAHSGGTTRWR